MILSNDSIYLQTHYEIRKYFKLLYKKILYNSFLKINIIFYLKS